MPPNQPTPRSDNIERNRDVLQFYSNAFTAPFPILTEEYPSVPETTSNLTRNSIDRAIEVLTQNNIDNTTHLVRANVRPAGRSMENSIRENTGNRGFSNRRTVSYNDVPPGTIFNEVQHGQCCLNNGIFVANHPDYPMSCSVILGQLTPTLGEEIEISRRRNERQASEIIERQWSIVAPGHATYYSIDGRERGRSQKIPRPENTTDMMRRAGVFINKQVKGLIDPSSKKKMNDEKAKEPTLTQQKLKYINEVSGNELMKSYNFIAEEVLLRGQIVWDIYYDKEWEEGLQIVFKNDNPNSRNSVWDDSVSLETFKSRIHLCYVKAERLMDSNYEEIDGKVALIRNHHQYLSGMYFDTNDYKLIVNKDGLSTCKNDGHSVYYDPKIMPKLVKVTKVHDLTGSVQYIVQIGEVLTTDKGILSDLISAIKYCHRLIDTQYNEIRRQYIIDSRKPKVKSKKHQSNKKGLYVSHDVPFSCEIECYGKDSRTVAKVSHTIHKDIGLSGDGSLNSGIGYPIELQTPILKGKRGEICVAELCSLLVETGFKVDKTCGLHIHLDGTSFGLREEGILECTKRPTTMINSYLAYRIYEKVILSFLPSTRRNNQYCADFGMSREYHNETIAFHSIQESMKLMEKINTIREFELYWYKAPSYDHVVRAKGSRYTPSRYYGVNFHSLLKDNHLEIRYHSGTLNYEKILYWTDFHGKMLEKCADGTITLQLLKDVIRSNMSLEAMTENLFSILDLNKDTVEYLYDRQNKFKDAKASEEILIDKTKKLEVI